MAHALIDAQRFYCGHSWGWLVGALWADVRNFYQEHQHELGKRYAPRRDDVLAGATWDD
jgi:hypothetical protein